VIAVAFLAGVGTYHFTRYAPLDKSLGEAQTDLEEANSELSILRSDNQKSDTTISTLQEELDKANAHVDILQLLADANEARLALIAKDIEGAKTALENSAETLESILPLIAEVDANLAQSMSQRLGLIISELERDSASAQVDLELLTKDLLTAEEALSK
jgi:chromosome segregation ATPase